MAKLSVISFLIQMKDFRNKAGTSLPNIPKSQVQGRNDFESLRELVDYLHDEDRKREKELKKLQHGQQETK